MAKKSAIENNARKRRLAKQYAAKRERLHKIVYDKKLPRNSSKTRIRNRCELSGRPRATYRKLKLSRIALRELGSKGMIPGLVKSSW